MERDAVGRFPIYQHGEGIAIECGDDDMLVVDYSSPQQHFVHVFAEYEDSLVTETLILIVFLVGSGLRCRRRRGGRWWSSSGGRNRFGLVRRPGPLQKSQ